LSYKTILLVQALKSLGKERATQEVIKMLSDKLTAEEKNGSHEGSRRKYGLDI
jgi:hypothetical protein